MMNRLALLLALATPAAALGHDTWVQTNTNLVRTGDAVHIDLMLGNHGNEHRDFKLAGKLSLEGATLEVIGPDGSRYDLKDRLIDTGYTPQEGYWTTRFEPAEPGLYMVAHRSDRVMSYAPERSIKSGEDVLRREQEPRPRAHEQPRLRPAARATTWSWSR